MPGQEQETIPVSLFPPNIHYKSPKVSPSPLPISPVHHRPLLSSSLHQPPTPSLALPIPSSAANDMSDSYFPPTPPHDDAGHDEPTDLKMPALAPNSAATLPNGPTGTRDAPNRVSLKLSHLPSRQKIKPVYPRSPSAVCIYSLVVLFLSPAASCGPIFMYICV